MWFEKLMGFEEISPENVQEKINVEENKLISKVNGKSFQCGVLEVSTLKELEEKTFPLEDYRGKIKVSEVVGDVQKLHADLENKGALFQAASQFNLLEMIGPQITPRRGVDIYERDYTQGPACAIACGAGTIYRNYFAPINDQIGQTGDHQINCLDLVGKALKNEELLLWKMSNGYALANQNGLLNINLQLNKLDNSEREHLKGLLKIGLQWDTEVTISENRQVVSQAYCSALPVAYSQVDAMYWEKFARLILEATYEATLYAGLINLEKTGSDKVFLTLVGGGAFGNDMDWIMESLALTIQKFKNTPLDIRIVSYGRSNSRVQELINKKR